MALTGGTERAVAARPGWRGLYVGGGAAALTTALVARRNLGAEGSNDALLAKLGYEAADIVMDQDYGTVERVVRTYGFIHSKRAIDYIRQNEVTTIRWKFRARFRTVA